MKEPLRIGILGGAFDPPHNGHRLAIQTALDSELIDEVWVVPSGERDDKRYSSGDADRLEMARLLVAEFGTAVRLVDLELRGDPKPRGTVELFESLRVRYPRHEFYLVIGSELLPQLHSWRHFDRLREEVRFLVIYRCGEGNPVVPDGVRAKILAGREESATSSTAIREQVREGRAIGDLTIPAVAAYIGQSRLYSR